MHRSIALVVGVTAIAIAVQVVIVITRVIGSAPLPQLLVAVPIVLALAWLVWLLLARSIRAWRKPSPKNIRKLYNAFAWLVFFASFGLLRAAIDGTGAVVAVVVPMAGAAIVAVSVHLTVLRWTRDDAEHALLVTTESNPGGDGPT